MHTCIEMITDTETARLRPVFWNGPSETEKRGQVLVEEKEQ